MELRVCTDCGKPQLPDQFYVKNKQTGRLDNLCKTCRKARSAVWIAEHPDKHTASVRKWQEQHPEAVIDATQRYRERYPDRVAAQEAHRKERPLPDITKQVCAGCGQLLAITEFHKKGPNRYHSLCKMCRKVEKAEYSAAHKDAIDSYNATYRAENADAVRERNRQWYADHPDRIRAIQRKSRQQRREAILAYNRAYRAANPDLYRTAYQNRRARLKVGGGTVTVVQWQAILTLFGHKCSYCGATDVPLEQEHIIPLSRGGQHEPANVTPACRSCNGRKSGKTAEEFFALLDDEDSQ